jgi:hypothetical protein
MGTSFFLFDSFRNGSAVEANLINHMSLVFLTLFFSQSKTLWTAYLRPVITTLKDVILADKILKFKSTLAIVLIIGGAGIGLLDFIPLKTLKKSSLRW